MKRNHTIGFEANCVNQSGTGPYNHARSVIEAIAASNERNVYMRLYVNKRESAPQEPSLDQHINIETMEPDGSIWRKMTKLWNMWGVTRDAHRGGVELFHALNNELPYGLSKYGIRSVVTIHDLMYLRYPSVVNIIERFTTRFTLRSACRRADRIIAVSECTKRDLVELLEIDAEKIDVIYPGCNPIFTQPIDREYIDEVRKKYELPDRYILNVGSQSSRKNVELIFDAMTKLDDEIHLVIVGNKTTHTNKLKRVAEKLNIDYMVHFVHNANNKELAAIYRGAEMMVYPTLYSSFGMPIAEAISVGTPVIAATGSSHEEAGGAAALYISPKDSSELAERIDAVLHNEELRAEMIKRGYEHASRFRPEVIAYNITNSYKRIGVNIMEW